MDYKQKIKILSIDDDRDNLDTIKDSLNELGYEIESEINPKRALEKIDSNYYDIVITDIMMPNVSGIEIAKAVKSTGLDSLVIVVTGFASVDTAIQSIQHGVYDYVQKPFTDIKTIVKRAVDYLLLQRNNLELGKQIEESLSKVSLLHDISTILYQMTDFNESSEMILDTIVEGFKINQTGIILKQFSGNYEIFKGRNLDKTFCTKFKFEDGDFLNNIKISTNSSTFINELSAEIKLNETLIPIDQSLKSMVLIPINFHINTLGYLIVFTKNGLINKNNDYILKLIEIFSTQIAPVVHSALKMENKKSCSEKYITNIIENKMIDAKSVLSPISFALVRIAFQKTPQELIVLEDYLTSASGIISKEISGHGEMHWQSKDTGLIVFPAADLFITEQFCMKLSEKIEELQLTGNKDKIISLKYSCINYPQSGSLPSTLANMLWKHLFEELEKKSERIDEFI